jgi:hypothetical protein
MVEYGPLTRRQFGEVIAGLGAAVALPSAGQAQGDQSVPTSLRETTAIENCLRLIRNCQHPNGAIAMRLEREPSDEEDQKQALEDGEDPRAVTVDTIRVVPYFANHSALALLSGHARHAPNVEDVKRVARWMAFYAKAQSPATGYITDYTGSRRAGTFFSSGHIDSVDAYASTFLQVAERYWNETRALPPRQQQEMEGLLPKVALLRATALSFKAIESVTDGDGLTWAKPDYKVKFLLDNVEVYGGLRAGQVLFDQVGAQAEAATAREMARRLGEGLARFWQEDRQRFVWGITDNGARLDGFSQAYPHALANLAGLAWISGESQALWQALVTHFTPSIDAPVERWLMAAIGLGDAETGKWRQRTIDEAGRCTARTNGQRTALLALTLCEGRSWMRSVAEDRKTVTP